MIEISVIIPCHNPNPTRLTQTLSALAQQTLSANRWELVLVDNASTEDLKSAMDLTWHPHHQWIKEETLGLTHARLAGFRQSKGAIMVLVDDDNCLAADYLEQVLEIFKASPQLGATGGKIIAAFEQKPPPWLANFYNMLAIRNFGDKVQVAHWENKYPQVAPVGAGMALRKSAIVNYLNRSTFFLDRTGKSLSSGGDNDIVIEILKAGWDVAYHPQLSLSHLIPPSRTTPTYMAKLVYDSNISWMQLLSFHGINPWKKINPKTLCLRKIKAWFAYRAWKSEVHYIQWRGACGMFKGLATK